METIRRINIDKVKEAFEIAQIIPIKGIMDSCVVAAICYPYTHFDEFVEAGFNKIYLYGVMDGWDFKTSSERWPNPRPEIYKNDIKYKLGLADGIAAAKIMEPKEISCTLKELNFGTLMKC